MWLGFFKECMVSLIFLGINLPSLSITFFLILFKVVICLPAVFSNFILITVAISDRSFVFIWSRFQRPFRFPEVGCFTVTTVSFISDIVFIFCNYSIFRFTKEFTQSLFSVESWSYFMRSEYTPHISCCDWGKLW